jgi:methyltransferase (TIGR00027 family)
MQDDKPSVTAYRVALRRAAHQVLDEPKVFDDPLALAIVGGEGETRSRSGEGKSRGRIARSMRAYMAMRSRYAEDRLAEAVERGARQYVVLGAGLDTFPYRNPYPADRLHVFEVDHPATQGWKRRRLAKGGIVIPESMTFAPVDFERQTLADGLAQAGFRSDRITFFSWLGVVPYLTRNAVLETLAFVAAQPGGSEVVFDYGLPPASLNWLQRLAFANLASRVAAAGEPFQIFFTPDELAAELRLLGFGHLEDSGMDEMNRRYFAHRADGLRVTGGLAHVMAARVCG